LFLSLVIFMLDGSPLTLSGHLRVNQEPTVGKAMSYESKSLHKCGTEFTPP
jgi:hypothetical protein